MQTRLLLLASLKLFSLVSGEDSKSLFDGKSFDGWDAPDMSYWSIEDGAITASSSDEHPCKKNQFLVWQGRDIGDFVLTLKFRVDRGPKANSGIQVRSQLKDGGQAVWYQMDISQLEAPWHGAIYDEHGCKMLAARGEKTMVEADGSFAKSSVDGSVAEAIASYDAGEWNDYEISGEENKITVKLNGKLTSEVVDLQEEERELSGILAMQLHSGPPMKV